MSSTPAPKPELGVIRVSFDVDQIGNRLMWSASDNGKNAYVQFGPNAGTLHFDFSTDVTIDVTAYGKPQSPSLASFEIVSAALITVPQMVSPGVWSPPSPFSNEYDAVLEVTSFTPCTPPKLDPVTGYLKSSTTTVEPLPVESHLPLTGMWELSVVLTVNIYRQDASGPSTTPQSRVFALDPESQVGNGTR